MNLQFVIAGTIILLSITTLIQLFKLRALRKALLEYIERDIRIQNLGIDIRKELAKQIDLVWENSGLAHKRLNTAERELKALSKDVADLEKTVSLHVDNTKTHIEITDRIVDQIKDMS